MDAWNIGPDQYHPDMNQYTSYGPETDIRRPILVRPDIKFPSSHTAVPYSTPVLTESMTVAGSDISNESIIMFMIFVVLIFLVIIMKSVSDLRHDFEMFIALRKP